MDITAKNYSKFHHLRSSTSGVCPAACLSANVGESLLLESETTLEILYLCVEQNKT